MKIFKTFVLGAALVAASSLTGCDFVEGFIAGWKEAGDGDVTRITSAGLVSNQPAQQAVVNGNFVEHVGDTCEIIFFLLGAMTIVEVVDTNGGFNFVRFEAVYNGLLGKSVAGTAAMIPMAIELYARDAEVGERCLDLLCNSDATVSNITRILKTKLVPSQYAQENDSYLQRYMAAALLKGAVNTNAYTPDKPYTVEMPMSPNGVKEAPLMGGDVTYIYILAQGWDTFQRGVDVFLPYDTEYYKVAGCSSCYTQCKNIRGTWPGLE